MAKKVTPELARIRGIPPGIDLRSPSCHPDILGGDDLLIKVEELREATGYRLPVSVKLGAGRVSDDVKIAVKGGFDFIELNGMQGSTGAGSAEVIDYVGVPTLPAIIEVIDALEEIGRRQEIEIVLMGGIRDGIDAVKALCLSANAIAFGTSTIIAGGCIACMQCHIGQCMTGIATQDPEHEQRYDAEFDRSGMMGSDRVHTEWDSMRTSDPKVFAAGDGAFGGSTIVMAMHHGQRAAYYLRHFLEGEGEPLPYRTPYRTRRVPVAQDLMWEKFPIQEPVFVGLGGKPAEFPEIELTYNLDTARAEAARCYRCDAETGSADYSVLHREDIFSMARTDPGDGAKLKAMLDRRMRHRDNPFPEERPASLDDIVFLPANLSRLVIDPYREACRIAWKLGERLDLGVPFFVAGFDEASRAIAEPVDRGVAAAGGAYLGARRPGPKAPWLQLCEPGRDAPDPQAAGVVYRVGERWHPMPVARAHPEQMLGLHLYSHRSLEDAIVYGLERGFDLLVLDGTGAPGREWPELAGAPDLSLLRETIAILRRLRKEEMIDIAWFGGVRSGTDAAKLIGLGVNAIGHGVSVALALGGEIADGAMRFAPDRSDEEREEAVRNILKANAGEASMMARCAGKTRLHNIEPEDLRAVTRAAASATGIPLAGTRAA